MVDATGIEPVTPSMSTRCSPAELRIRQDGSRRVRNGKVGSITPGTRRPQGAFPVGRGQMAAPFRPRAAGRAQAVSRRAASDSALNQAATIRSTSPTRSRRWMGLASTLAWGLAWAADRATAAKPVMNMMRMPG